MAVLNWFKDTLESGHKLFFRSVNFSTRRNDQAKQNLIRQQRALAEHFRKSSENFVDNLESLTQKIAESMDNSRSFEHIKNKQQALFYACLRLEIALKNNSELRRERKEWERRLPCAEEIDAYHPLIRLELIDSELRVREERLTKPQAQTSPPQIPEPIVDRPSNITDKRTAVIDPSKTELAAGVNLKHAHQPQVNLDTPEQEYIIRHAEEILLELSSEHNNAMSGHEFSEKSAELRNLYKTLNKMRSNNQARGYRLRLRERMSQLFS